MNTRSLWHIAIGYSSLVGLILVSAIFYKTYFKREPHSVSKSTRVKLDPSRVQFIKIVKTHRNGRHVSSTRQTEETLSNLFGPFGPLKGLSAHERSDFKKEVVSFVDYHIRRGAIDPRHRLRFIEMKVMDKSLEMLEARAEN